MVYVNLDRLLILSIGFFLLFSAFGTAQSLAATVLSENGLNNLGFYSLSLLYLSFGICSLFSSIVVHRLGTRYSMILGSMCYSCYIGSFILAAQPQVNSILVIVVILIAAALNGFGASILWVANGRYISECATDDNMGKFNSIFWAIYMGSALVGDLFGAFFIAKVNQTIFYSIMTCFCILASLFFLLLRPPIEVNKFTQHQHVTWRSIFDIIKTPRMMKFLPLCITSGFCIAGNAGIFVPLLEMTMKNTLKSEGWSSAIMNQRALISLSVLGLGEIFGGILFGKIMDRFGHKITIISCMGALITSIVCICSYIAVFKFNIWAGAGICFLWGVQEAGMGVFLQCVAGFEFDSKTTPFAAKSLVQSLATFTALNLESLLTSQSAFMWYTISVGLFGISSWLIMLLSFQFVAKNDQQKQKLLNASETLDVSENETYEK